VVFCENKKGNFKINKNYIFFVKNKKKFFEIKINNFFCENKKIILNQKRIIFFIKISGVLPFKWQ